MLNPTAIPITSDTKSSRSGSSMIGISGNSGHKGQPGQSGRGGVDRSSSLSTRKPMAVNDPEAAPTVKALSISLIPNFAVSNGKCMQRHIIAYYYI